MFLKFSPNWIKNRSSLIYKITYRLNLLQNATIFFSNFSHLPVGSIFEIVTLKPHRTSDQFGITRGRMGVVCQRCLVSFGETREFVDSVCGLFQISKIHVFFQHYLKYLGQSQLPDENWCHGIHFSCCRYNIEYFCFFFFQRAAGNESCPKSSTGRNNSKIK